MGTMSCATSASRSATRRIPHTSAGYGGREGYDRFIVTVVEVKTRQNVAAEYSVVNGEVSGVKDVTQKELGEVRGRLESILGTVRFEAK